MTSYRAAVVGWSRPSGAPLCAFQRLFRTRLGLDGGELRRLTFGHSMRAPSGRFGCRKSMASAGSSWRARSSRSRACDLRFIRRT